MYTQSNEAPITARKAREVEPTPDRETADESTTSRISRRGFAGMAQDRQREIASLGGRAAHERGSAHEFSSEEARAAGRKGGQSVSADRNYMAEIGRKGGEARGQRMKRRQQEGGPRSVSA